MFSVRENLAESDVIPEQAGTYYWNWIALHETLSEDDMREFVDHFNWRKLSDHQQMSESFIRENADRVHWDRISQRIQMSEDFINEFQDKVTWDYIWSYQKHISNDFIEQHLKGHGRVDWDRIVMYQKLSEDFIKKHIEELNVDKIFDYQKPRKEMYDFLLKEGKKWHKKHTGAVQAFERSVLWKKMRRFQLTEKEILRYIKLQSNKVWGGGRPWYTILENQSLTEEFIEKHMDEIRDEDAVWYLCRRQKLSEDFLKRYEEVIDCNGKPNFWNAVAENRKIKKTAWIKEKIK